MTNILVVGARGIPNMEGGAEKNAEKVLPLIVDAGYPVELLAISSFLRSNDYKGVRLTGVPTVAFFKTDKIIYNFLAFLYAAVKRPKIVHMQCLNAALFLVLYKMVGLRVVVRYGSADYELIDKWGFVARLGLKACEYQMRFADEVIAVSETLRENLVERHGLKRISVIPNGLDPAVVSEEALSFKNSLGLHGKRYVLAVGRVTPQKDFTTLVEAVRGLDDPEVCLVVVGGGDSGYGEAFFEAQDPRIRFIGRVERDLLPALYRDCAVYVNSSVQEGLSNAILEALSFSCPLVLSDIPANSEMGLPRENYFAAGNADELREKIRGALADPDAYRCRTDRFVEWIEVANRTLEVYQRLIPGRAVPEHGRVKTSEQAGEALR